MIRNHMSDAVPSRDAGLERAVDAFDQEPRLRSVSWAIAVAPLALAALSFGFYALPGNIDTRAASLSGTWKIHEGHDRALASAAVDDSAWADIELPGGYGAQGFSASTCWLRKRVEAPRLRSGESGFITLGDTRGGVARVYLNGQFVGETGVVAGQFKPDLSGLYGWEFDGRLLRGDGLDVVAVQFTWGRLGYDGVGDPRMYIGSAEVLKPYHAQNRALRDAIWYGGLGVCVLFMVLVGILWLGGGDDRRHYGAAFLALVACGYYLLSKTGLLLGFFVDTVVSYNLQVIAGPLLSLAVVEFVERYCLHEVTVLGKGNRAISALAFLGGSLAPVDLTYRVAQIFSLYLLLALGYALYLAVRDVQRGRRTYALVLAAGLGYTLLFVVVDLLIDMNLVAGPHLLPLAVANLAVAVGVAMVGELVAAVRAHRSELAQLQGQAADLHKQLAHADTGEHMKARFLETMTHELRAPLGSIASTQAQLVAQFEGTAEEPSGWVFRGDPGEARELLEAAGEAATGLLDMLGDLTEMSRLDDDEPEFTRVPVPAATLVEKACARVSRIAERRAITLVPGDVPESLHPLVDTERTVQVLVQLLKNAIKFSPDGSRVEVRARREDRRCLFEVQDRGIGIAAEHHDAIFERFFQVEHDDDRDYGGSGLGLALARQLTELQGGQISVESEVGKGSVFTVSLPVAKRTGAVRE